MPEIRTGMALAAYDGNIYAIAGEGPDGVSSGVFLYLPAEDRWEQLSDKPTPVADVEGALIGEKIYVPGGRLADGKPTDILEIYDPRQDVWERGASLPKKISNYAMADFEGKLYIFGGWDGEKPLMDVYVYDPEEDVWGEGTPMAIARQDAGAVALADKIVVLGGRNTNGDLKDAKAYFSSRDVNDEKAWEQFDELPFELNKVRVVRISDAIYVFGSETSDFRNEKVLGIVYSSDEWVSLSTSLSCNNCSINVISPSSLLYIIKVNDELTKSEIWSYQAFYYNIYLPFVP
jgi:hypothetical protein